MMSKPYAHGTTVPVSRSLGEIEKLMVRFGVDITQGFTQVKRGGQYQCWWQIDGTTFTAHVDMRDEPDDREIRRRWRVLVFHIKGQLMAVEEGLLDAKVALAPFLMLKDGSMGKETMLDYIEAHGHTTPMLGEG